MDDRIQRVESRIVHHIDGSEPRTCVPTDVVAMILKTIFNVAEVLDDCGYEEDRVAEFTGKIRRLCNLLEEADRHRALRIQIHDINAGLFAKLCEIEPASAEWFKGGKYGRD